MQSCTLCSHEHECCTSIHSSCGSITFAQHSHKKSILRSWSGIFKHFEWVTFFIIRMHLWHSDTLLPTLDHMLNDKVMENCVIVTSCSESISCIIHTSHSLLFSLKQLTARHNNVEYSSVRTTNTFLRATKIFDENNVVSRYMKYSRWLYLHIIPSFQKIGVRIL